MVKSKIVMTDIFSLFVINRISFLKANEKLKLVNSTNDCASVVGMKKGDMEEILKRRIYAKLDFERYKKEAERDLRYIESDKGINYAFYWDSEYPPQLREIYDPPYLLFYRGRVPDYFLKFVTIVGTRHASAAARRAARRVSSALGEAGVVVVSGLARGIDAEAHIGCVSSGGCSISVIGNGIDSVYPVSNRWIAREILKSGGTVFSEYPPGDPPLKHHFPERNRILSGLSSVILVVEAPARSGALITANYAIEQGRDVLVHSAGLKGKSGEGTRALKENGAGVIDSSRDIFGLMGIEYGRKDSDINLMGPEKCSTAEYLSKKMLEELEAIK